MDWPGLGGLLLGDSGLGILSTLGRNGPCNKNTAASPLATPTWPVANLAIYVPIRVPIPVTVYQLCCGTGTGTTGNFDLGVYDSVGTRLVSTGSTAKSAASTERIIDVTDTLLLPGLYYLAMNTDGTTAYVGSACGSNGQAKLMGMRQQAVGAVALPATATFATAATPTFVPAIGAFLRSEV